MSRARINADQAHTESLSVVPHIIPDVLYPAVGGKGIDGATTVTSFGTDFAITGYATLKYYYTDIKGSKPIKDPRIGAHFGSQRYKFKSLQLLEQETATHGENIHSVDGREWMRVVKFGAVENTANGNYLNHPTGSSGFMEVTGYFNAVNLILGQWTTRETITPSINGVAGSAQELAETSVTSPLSGRYVDYGSVVSVTLPSTTLGINTIKLQNNTAGSNYGTNWFGIELIAQDTTSTTTKSQIQIPSQNVVSYGKKFTVAETKHYNPFAFKTDGTTAWASGAHNGTAWPIGTGSSTNIDTATSLGLAAWVSTNYYKPYNGGRVVKWIASDGTIKTSVNMMPPNARSIANSASLTNATAKANASIANNTFYPTFEATAVDHSQAEVAKTFHFREFGNGNANGGTAGAYKDASMLTGVQDIAYVMDDGLTSLAGDDVNPTGGGELSVNTTGDSYYLTFIGTGLTRQDNSYTTRTEAQNLPYGTHILKVAYDGALDLYIDGISLDSTSGGATWETTEFTIHQPKMPPIPEDAVVISDYMLMADFVPQSAAGTDKISKGVRSVSGSRDGFYDGNAAINVPISYMAPNVYQSHSTSNLARIPAFGTNIVKRTYKAAERYQLFYINDTAHSSADATTKVGTGHGSAYYPTSSVELGNNIFETYGGGQGSDGNDTVYTQAWEIASPIHTSSHYQTFESPFLHDLVGGDRNMEQNNLVVTADGKSWDEVTRDTSYIGNMVLQATSDTGGTASATVVVLDEWRGGRVGDSPDLFNKDFAIAYDRMICLVAGQYEITVETLSNTNEVQSCAIYLNGTMMTSKHTGSGLMPVTNSNVFSLTRGDYFQVKGMWYDNTLHNSVRITRV